MSKYERLLIYPLLILALAYSFLGNPAMQASQETAVFNRIEASDIVIKNDQGTKVVSLGSTSLNGGIVRTFNEDGVLGTYMVTEFGGSVVTFNTDGVGVARIRGVNGGGELGLYNKNEVPGIIIGATPDSGGGIMTLNKEGNNSVLIGSTPEGDGGVWVNNRFGGFSAFYGHSK